MTGTEQKKPKQKKRIGLNVFTALVVAASLSFAFRLVNIFTFRTVPADTVGIVKSAEAEGENEKATPAHGEEPPPLTQADVKKAIEETSKKVDETLPDNPVVKGLSGDEAGHGEVDAGAAPDDGGNRSFSSSEIEVLQSLSKRRDEIDARSRALDEREALLKAGEQEVDRKIAELNKMKGEIEKLLGTQEKMEDDRIASLVKIYENMKPKEAATIFNTLDMDVLLSVVSRMNERKLSPVLASMDPDKARLVTIKLAEQRKLPGRDKDEEKKAGDSSGPSNPPPSDGGSDTMPTPALSLPPTH